MATLSPSGSTSKSPGGSAQRASERESRTAPPRSKSTQSRRATSQTVAVAALSPSRGDKLLFTDASRTDAAALFSPMTVLPKWGLAGFGHRDQALINAKRELLEVVLPILCSAGRSSMAPEMPVFREDISGTFEAGATKDEDVDEPSGEPPAVLSSGLSDRSPCSPRPPARVTDQQQPFNAYQTKGAPNFIRAVTSLRRVLAHRPDALAGNLESTTRAPRTGIRTSGPLATGRGGDAGFTGVTEAILVDGLAWGLQKGATEEKTSGKDEGDRVAIVEVHSCGQ